MSIIDPLKLKLDEVPAADPGSGADQPPATPAAVGPADDGAEQALSRQPSFRELVDMLRSGVPDLENEAVHLLHKNYYAALHLVIRGILNSHLELNLLAESNVFWDSLIMVLTDKEVDLDHTNPVLLLKTIVKRKMINEMNHLGTERQGGEAVVFPITTDGIIARHDPTASPYASEQELRESIEKKKQQVLTDEEWSLTELHAEGRTWAEIGAVLETTPDAARVNHNRALEKLRKTIGEVA